MEHERAPSSRGFTLIEVIGALVIFSVGVIAAGSLSRGLTEQMRDAAIRSEASAVGLATLDSLAAFLTYDSISASATGDDTVTIDGVTFTRSWTEAQAGLRVREVELVVEGPIADGPTFTGAIYFVEEW